MSQLKVDNITDEEGTGAPNFSNGVALSGTPLSGVASEAEAQAGTDNAHVMTPLRVRNALNASGSAPIFACRAWVNFDGTGTVAIRASGNVSSVTDLGVGAYRINFATAMPDSSYSVVTSSTGPVNQQHCVTFVGSLNTTSVEYAVFQTNNSTFRADEGFGMIAIFR